MSDKTSKVCSVCEESKPLSEFYRQGLDGKTRAACKVCYTERRRAANSKRENAPRPKESTIDNSACTLYLRRRPWQLKA